MATNAVIAKRDVRSWWGRKDFGNKAIGSAKAGLAAAVSLSLANLLGLSHAYWAAISAIVVLGWDSTLTVASCRDRIIGTAIGAFMGWATSYFWHSHYFSYAVAVALCIFVCSGLQFDKAGRLAAATLSLIVLVQPDNRPGHIVLSRFLETGIGVVVALGMSLLPPRLAKTDATPTI